jgi:hypothetical protein
LYKIEYKNACDNDKEFAFKYKEKYEEDKRRYFNERDNFL